MTVQKTIQCKYCKQHKSRANFIHYGAHSETCVHCGHAKREFVQDLELPDGYLMEPDGALNYLYNICKGI